MYHDFKIPGHFTALVSLLIVSSSVSAQNFMPLVSEKYSGRNTVKKVTVEENWNGVEWMNFAKTIKNYNINSNCFEQVTQKWNKYRWVNDKRILTCYDRLQLENAKMVYRWNRNGSWEMIEGERAYVDTIMSNGCRLVLQNCNWEPQKKIWIAEDSIFYDAQGRIIKLVSNESDDSEGIKKGVRIVTASEYIYQNDDTWMEIQTTCRSDKKRAEKEQFRYRKISDFPLQVFMIDCWDDRINRWIQNTAKLYKKNDNKFSVYDSIEESINGKFVPVYVEAEDRDSAGNLMSQRIQMKNYDETRKKWSGYYYKWERVRCNNSDEYSAAESSFTLSPAGGNWILTSYEKKLCRIPISGGYEEFGNYDENFKTWEYFQTYDTLYSFGVILNRENFFDTKNSRWIPLTNLSSTRAGDSISILKTYFDVDNNSWYNDSLFTIQLDSSGEVVSRTNQVWTQSGLFSERWDNVSRISYIKE